MRLLFTRFPLESALGGAEIQTITLMQGLIDRGHAVAFLGSCPTLLQLCRERGIPAIELDIGPPPVTKLGSISFAWRQGRMRRKIEEAVGGIGQLDGVLMLSLSEKLVMTESLTKHIPVFWIEHDRVGRWLRRNPWLGRLRKLSEQATTIAVSELSRKIYLELGWPEEKIIAIPNGVEVPGIRNKTPKHHEAEPKTAAHIGCVARLTHDKGVDILVEAMQGIDARLTIIGSGPEQAAIEQQIRSLAMSDRITLLPSGRDLSEFYASLDLLVLPSRDHDPFGLVAAEAMMRGIPVIVSDMCGIAGYMTHKRDAMIVPTDSPLELQRILREMLSDEGLSDQLGRNGRETALAKFTVSRMVDDYEKLLKKSSASAAKSL